jgi:hypothetical protein
MIEKLLKKTVAVEDYGRDTDDLDIWMHVNIAKKWQKFEVSLYTTKWFDYRFLHPVQATMRYTEAYEPIYRRLYTESVNSRAGPYVSVFKGDFFSLDGAVKTGLWRGRQIADAIGMPYSEYINASFRETMRHWRQPFLPRPYHLYATDVIEKVVETWGKLQEVRSYVSEEPEYLTDVYQGLPIQNDHHEWILGQAARRGIPAIFLERMVHRNLLPIEKVEMRFGAEIAQQIRQSADILKL